MEDEAPNRPANRVDDTILRYADSRSPEEISVMLKGAIGPKTVASRTQTLLKSRSWLTVAQEEQVVLQKMRDLLIEIENKNQDDKMFALRIKAVKEIGALIEKRKASVDMDLHALYGNQAVIMGQAIELALQKALKMLQAAHPELEDAEVREALKHALPEAAAEIQARTINE